MATEFLFQKSRQSFKDTLLKDIKKKNFATLTQFVELYSSYAGTEPEKRTVSDQTLRDLLQEKLSKKDAPRGATTVADVLNIITVSVSIAKQGFCSPSMPFILVGDILDCHTLDQCDEVFQYIEDRVATWKSGVFYQAGKNYLLRMCNDLLRRLSQSQNTVFCGRIQLFLARLFPLSEKSALNLVSQFNLDNVTIFNKAPDGNKAKETNAEAEKDEVMDVDAIDINAEENDLNATADSNEIIDYKLYNDIWSLQDMFRYPIQCYNKDLWEKFVKHADCLFKVFSSYKLEDVPSTRRQSTGQQSKSSFFKFLTSEKLTNLQLNDTMFRRQILTQFLILFQYLTAIVKFKSNNMTLSEGQKTWIKVTTQKIFEILDETPPNGKEFSKYIRHILDREDYWIAWKNDSCPSFMKTPEKASANSQAPAAKKRKLDENQNSVGDDFLAGKPLGIGSPELTKLWNLCPDNLEACRSGDREFVPSLKEYFEECIEQEDPKNQIEDQYKLVKNSNFQWKALRLLSNRSQLFFQSQPAQMQFKTVPDYLTTIVKKLEKEFPSNAVKQTASAPSTPKQETANVELSQENEKNDLTLDDDPAAKEADGEDGVLDEDESLGEDEALMDDNQDDASANVGGDTGEGVSLDTLSSDDITMFASKIAGEWKKLASNLNISAKDIKEIQEDSEDPVLQARQTLVTWQDFSKAKATYSNLIQAMKASGLENLTKDV